MNKTILITGASSGIGKETAKYFQSKGWNVIATMRSPDKEKELSIMENVLVVKMDVLDLQSIDKAVHRGLEQFGGIDVLLNNAGYGAYGPLESFPREHILRQFNTNVIGLLDVTRAVLPHFRARHSGTIINISSIGGKMTFPLGSLYHGSKFAVEGISESLSFEMEAIGVKVRIIEPGGVATDFAGRSFDFQNNESMMEYQEMVGKTLHGFEETLGDTSKLSKPSLIAAVIYHAATDSSNRLRYRAGKDAEILLTRRVESSDAHFLQGIKQQFKL